MACDFLPRSFRSHDIKRPDDDFDDAEDDDTAGIVLDRVVPKSRHLGIWIPVIEK